MQFTSKEVLTLCSLVLVFGIAIGVTGYMAYEDFKGEREINGFYLESNFNKTQTDEYAQLRDKKGDWVCINVAYNMPPKLAYETCVHECTHRAYSEILAEKCEDDYDGCLNNLFKEWEE